MEESKRSNQTYEEFPMNGGQNQYSYAQNSSHQRLVADVAKHIIREATLEMLDLETLLHNSSNVIRIADLGCSVGPNTFFIVQNIIDSVNILSHSQGHSFDHSLEFQVFFNDHVGNDFNTLFKSLPEDKKYYVAAVPGSFHGRLFPESSIHIFNSTYALHWLSRVPKEIVDKNSPAYNKGKIFYADEDQEVIKAYFSQFERDFESFLNSRALEIVPGGIMALTIFCVPPDSKNGFHVLINVTRDILVEMANEGLISHELLDSFNIPIYTPAPEEVRELIKKNGKFKIEKSELLYGLRDTRQQINTQMICMHMRASLEGVFKEHFEEGIVDELFVRFEKLLVESFTTLFPVSNKTYKDLGGLFVMKRTVV